MPITRGQFVKWLLKSYNVMHNEPIIINSSTSSSFADVSTSNSYFIYIQSAYDAGLIAGFDDGTFKPEEYLTREQMIALKSQLDSSIGKDSRPPESLKPFMTNTQGFVDGDTIGDRYVGYTAFDSGNAAGGRNFQRVYGKTRRYQPQKPVTREEAAILLSQFRKGKPIEKVIQQMN